MKEDLYLQIIKKQQELIGLFISAGIQSNSDFLTDTNDHKVESKNYLCDLDGFSEWMKKKGISQNAIDSYTTTVRIFFEQYKELTIETLSMYEDSLSKWKPKTINARIAGMYKYFKYIGFDGYEFKRAKEQKKTFCDNAINEEQYYKLIEWSKDNQRKVWLICKVIASTGVRVSELISLKTNDIQKGYVDIVGKGGKSRRIYFPQALLEEIKEDCGNNYLIENRYGKQMTTRGVSQLLINVSEKAGIPKEVMHPHSFRHFFAKQFLKNKNDISLLGDLLGHSNISTTAIYTRMTSEEQQKEIDKIVGW